MQSLIFDTSPLSHFARIESLEVLRVVVGERRSIIPQAVVVELQRGVQNDLRIRAVLEASWIEQRDTQADDELAAYAEFASRLVSGGRNVGDAAVLALARRCPVRLSSTTALLIVSALRRASRALARSRSFAMGSANDCSHLRK